MSRNTDSIPTGPYSIGDEDAWAQASFEIAKTLYEGITENEAVPQAYIDKNKPIAESQIMKGGYRLAYILDHIFSDAKSDDFIAKEIAGLLTAFLQ